MALFEEVLATMVANESGTFVIRLKAQLLGGKAKLDIWFVATYAVSGVRKVARTENENTYARQIAERAANLSRPANMSIR